MASFIVAASCPPDAERPFDYRRVQAAGLGAALRSAVVEVRFDTGRLTSRQLADLEGLARAGPFSIDALSADRDGPDAAESDPDH